MIHTTFHDSVNSLNAVESSYRKFLVKICMLLGLPVCGFYMVYDFFIGRYLVGIVLSLMFLILVSLFLVICRSNFRAKEDLIYRYFLKLLFLLFGFHIAYTIGIEGNLSRIPWSYVFPVVVFFALGETTALAWVSVLFSALLLLEVFVPSKQFIVLPELKLRFYVSFIMVIVASFFFERLKRRYQLELIANQEVLKRSQTRYRQAYEKVNEEMEQRKRIELALQESEEKHKLVVNNANDAIFIAQDNVIKFPNPKTLEMIGYSEEELTSIPFAELIHPEDKDMVVERHFKRLSGGKPPTTYSFRVMHKTGKELWVELNTVLITWETRPATLNFLRDITEKKKLEAQLQRAQKMEALGTLAGGVAHDLNNILSGTVSYPELLLLQISEDSPLRKPLLTIQESGKKAAAIVQDLLTLARRGVISPEVVNLNDLISEYLKSPEYGKLKLYHPGVDVETNLEADLFNILGSPVHLTKTIMNLVSNAAEAMTDGGKILISAENRYVDGFISGCGDVERGDYVTLTVSDTGIGISSKDIERIFEPFYTKKKMGRSGTGLGMTVVWGTIRDHKGYIDVQSTEGEGTTFTLYFPATRQQSRKDQPSLSIEKYKGRGESILVVDDVKEQREIASNMLITLGYVAHSVSSGEEAVEYLKDNSADLLILDMIMDPGIDGLETYKRILELQPKQKAIIASGFSETERVKEARRMGAGIYVKKPYSLETFGQTVRAELDK